MHTSTKFSLDMLKDILLNITKKAKIGEQIFINTNDIRRYVISYDKHLFRLYGTHRVTAAAHRQKQSNRVGTKHSEHSELISIH